MLHQIVVWGSIIIFFVAMAILAASTVFATAGGDYFGLAARCFGSSRWWLGLFVTVVMALLLDVVTLFAQSWFFPTLYDIYREKDAVTRKNGRPVEDIDEVRVGGTCVLCGLCCVGEGGRTYVCMYVRHLPFLF